MQLPTDPGTFDSIDPGVRQERLLPEADRVRRDQRHLRHARRERTSARTWSATATRSPVAGPPSTRRSAQLRPLFANLKPVSEVLADPRHRAPPVLRGAGPHRARSSPRSPSSRPTSSGNASIAFAGDLLRSRRAPRGDLRGRPAGHPGARPAAARAPVPDRVRRALAPAQPGRPPAPGRDPDAERRDHRSAHRCSTAPRR